MPRTLAVLAVLLISFSAFAADPRIEVRPLPPAGVSEQEAAAMEEAARLLGRSISQDVMIGSAGPLLAAKAEACAEDAQYDGCLRFRGGERWNPRDLMPANWQSLDAVLLCAFRPSPDRESYRGVYYLVPRSGKWVSSWFDINRKRTADGEVIVVKSGLGATASKVGLQVSEEARAVERTFEVPPGLR